MFINEKIIFVTQIGIVEFYAFINAECEKLIQLCSMPYHTVCCTIFRYCQKCKKIYQNDKICRYMNLHNMLKSN